MAKKKDIAESKKTIEIENGGQARAEEMSLSDGNQTGSEPVIQVPSSQTEKPALFPVVGIGASAGGLEAMEQFLSNVRVDSGIAFIIVQHLAPDYPSSLADILSRRSALPVQEAEDGLPVQPDHVYIIPPHKHMTIANRTLQLWEKSSQLSMPNTIDIFLKSLAEDAGRWAVGIILSGTGSDGSQGLREIKAKMGIVIAQEPSTARYDGMPRAAIATGLVDFVLAPEQMAPKLIDIQGRIDRLEAATPADNPTIGENDLQKVLSLVRNKTGHDFSGYKLNTIRRRIERRMIINQIETIKDYIHFMQDVPEESNSLFKEFLINVTSFFRDPEAFIILKQKLKDLLKGKPEGSTVRAWVVGCATGEEAYSVAIIIRESIDELERDLQIQVFGTDLDADAIAAARSGAFPPSIAEVVSEERLKKFFVQRENQFYIRKDIREAVVFAEHDITRAPPFSRMDLVSARNILIYMNASLQEKLLPVFYMALNECGLLFLGTSETVGAFSFFFSALDSKWKIYERKEGTRPGAVIPVLEALKHPVIPRIATGLEETRLAPASHSAEKALLEAMPPAVIIDANHRLVYVLGDIRHYLTLTAGEQPSMDIVNMAHDGLRLTIASGIREVVARQKEVVRNNIRVKYDTETHLVRLLIKPILDIPERSGQMILIFQDQGKVRKSPGPHLPELTDDNRVRRLEQELNETKDSLQNTIEELRSANEQYQSANEELQSTNEELDTSREELQSVNEELLTINTEYQKKIEEMTSISDDMKNLLNANNIATIFLDEDLKIKRFTPAATKVFNIIETDIGRPVEHVTTNLVHNSLAQIGKTVMDNLIPVEREMPAKDGKWYLARILPYRTSDNNIAGLVLSFIDITELKRLNNELKASLDYTRGIIDTLSEPILVLDSKLKILSANRSFYEYFQVTQKSTEGKLIYKLGNGQWNLPELRKLLEDILPQKSRIEGFLVEHEFPKIGRRKISLNARELRNDQGSLPWILLTLEEVTETGGSIRSTENRKI